MLSPSSESPFRQVEEDPIVHAARLAADAANGHLPTDASRKATLSTAPLQAPPRHITDQPHHPPLHQPSAASFPPPPPSLPPPLPAAADLAEGDAVVVTSPTSAAAPRAQQALSSSSSSSAPSSFSVVPSPAEGAGQVRARSRYKVVFLGDEAVGKTSLITRFMYDTFDAHYKF